ncbi:MAG: hypothetical protein J6C19_01000 [Lachnospiraceae bacterium]|nr:hypothetical protein [Lachnospiraceae bacterium]
MKKTQKQKLTGIILFSVSLLFYLLWYVLDGIILTEDAASYINMQSDREPGYCLYLMLLRQLFGTEIYLHIAVIGQCIIAAIAACAITLKLRELFSLNWLGSAGILAGQYGVTLLNRFVAQRRYSYFNSIETEGLAYSLWVFYFLCILGILYKRDKKSLIGAVVWSVVLISIRKHMLITLIILFFVILAAYRKEKGWIRTFGIALLACIIGFAGTKLVDCSYNWLMRGEFAPHTGDSSFILGTELYLADSDMERYIQDDEHRELFREIMKRADEKQYNIAYAGKGWQAIEDHYSSSYDRIKFDIVMVVIRENQEARGLAEADREADYNLIAGTMMKELLIPCIPRLIKLYFCNVLHGFITTILKVHPVLNWAALLLYLLYLGTLSYLMRQRRQSMEASAVSAVPLAWLVLFSIAVNVCFTSLTIYCQMRYMLYNTSLFYQAWWIMIVQPGGLRLRQNS